MAGDGVLDPRRVAALKALGGTDEPDLLARLVEAFAQGARATLARMAQALDAADARAVADLAHDLRGSSGNMGAQALYDLCTEVERAALQQEVAGGD
jgi:HPt (histidine-containing phosphotransfer) domain-containing protein